MRRGKEPGAADYFTQTHKRQKPASLWHPHHSAERRRRKNAGEPEADAQQTERSCRIDATASAQAAPPRQGIPLDDRLRTARFRARAFDYVFRRCAVVPRALVRL